MADRIAVITGAGSGAGQSIARCMGQRGFTVILLGRTQAKLVSVKLEIGENADIYALDLIDSKQLQNVASEIGKRFDHVDVLVNCAGEAFLTKFEDTTEADWDRILGINLKAPFMLTRALLPLLRKSTNASIVNIASKVALRGYPVSVYTAAKAGLVGFSSALAAELRDDEIRVAALCPGAMDTPMRWNSTPDMERRLVFDPDILAETVWHIVNLPRGVVTGEILLQSVYYD